MMARCLNSALLAAIVAALGWVLPAQAQTSSVATERVRASLISELRAVKPGERVTIALRQQIIPRWHVYWLNPGDSGLPTKIDWTLPKGASAGPIVWPTPRAIKIGPLVNYGYENDVWLLSEISVPADHPMGQPVVIGAHAKWLVCEEICIPEEGKLELMVPTAPASEIDAAQRADFMAARRAVPVAAPWLATMVVAPRGYELTIAMPNDMAQRITAAYYFAAVPDAVAHAAPQNWRVDGESLRLSLEAGAVPAAAGAELPGILTIKEKGGQNLAFAVQAKVAAGPAMALAPALTLPMALLYALLGGLILNLMPCVFPILSMKALAMLQYAGEARRAARAHGLAYVGGVLVGFAAIGGALVGLRAGGEAVGWGFQLQAPWFVMLLAFLMLAVGLNLSGVFSVGAVTIGQGQAGRGGLFGSLATGLLAVAVATPCTAPFMAAALGVALAQPAPVAMAIFLALGLGMALPWLAVAIEPKLLRALPRPGAWMEWLRRLLAFPMYATSAWLLWVLAQQVDAVVLAWALAGMVAIAFAAWLYGATRQSARTARLAGSAVAVVVLALALAIAPVTGGGGATSVPEVGADQSWEKFSPSRLAELRAAGTPVFVNMTAAWCITCLINERVALADGVVRQRMKEKGVVYLKGDWTRQDPEITAYLRQFGHSGVPLYVLYPRGQAGMPRILPQILLPGDIMVALDEL